MKHIEDQGKFEKIVVVAVRSARTEAVAASYWKIGLESGFSDMTIYGIILKFPLYKRIMGYDPNRTISLILIRFRFACQGPRGHIVLRRRTGR